MMRKILLLIFILCNLRNGFADDVNDSIRSYLTSNIKYPTIYAENDFIGSMLLVLSKPTDSTLKYQILTTTKFVAFEYETVRVIKQSAFLKLIPKNKNVFVKINFKIVDIDTSLISQNDTVLADKQIMLDLNKNDFIVIDKVIGENEKNKTDSLLYLYNNNPEQIWLTNSTNYKIERKDFISKKKLDASKIIFRYKYGTGYSVICSTNGISKPCSLFNEISISKNNEIKLTNYRVFGNKLENGKESFVINNYKKDSIIMVLNNLRHFPNQIKHRIRISDGWSFIIEIFFDNKKRTYSYYSPSHYAKDGYLLDKEFMKLFTFINSYFK